jgi:hypothetical protein
MLPARDTKSSMLTVVPEIRVLAYLYNRGDIGADAYAIQHVYSAIHLSSIYPNLIFTVSGIV